MPWGCCANDSGSAFCFRVGSVNWDFGNRGNADGVVLARAFGGDSQQSAQVSQNSDINILENDNSAFKDTKDISDIQTQQTINEPGSDVAVSDNDTTKEDVNKQISPYGYTDKKVDTGKQTTTGQSSGTATCGQVATDSGGQAQADSGGSASASQSAAPPDISLNTFTSTG